jgi:peptidyl-prolyl cis-trans isomerase B (cyclophilin B)
VTIPPPYGTYPPDYYGYPVQRPTNGMAIASIICAFLFAPLGILFGHISLSQIKRTGEEGRGLAVAGLVIGYLLTLLAVVAVVLSAIVLVLLASSVNTGPGQPGQPGYTAAPSPPGGSPLPPFNPPANLGAGCSYPATTEKASKPVTPPRSGKVPTQPPMLSASITTNLGGIGLRLDNAKAPCTVNSFVSLAGQGFFDGTPCHRLTTTPLMGVLQCGDPTGTGMGGPGYQFANEYPTNQYRLTDPALKVPVVYPRGTLAMANAGPGTNGSQFFLVYADSSLPPTYTAFGSIDNAGLTTIDKIAAAGVAGAEDGKPVMTVTITSVRAG